MILHTPGKQDLLASRVMGSWSSILEAAAEEEEKEREREEKAATLVIPTQHRSL